MQVARILGLLIVLGLSFKECNAQKVNGNKEYSIEAFQSENKNDCYIIMETFHFEQPKDVLPVSFLVNNVFINDEIVGKKILRVSPGQFKINAMFPGKLMNDINFSAKKGDSISVKIYLKNDLEPLHPYPDILIPDKN